MACIRHVSHSYPHASKIKGSPLGKYSCFGRNVLVQGRNDLEAHVIY